MKLLLKTCMMSEKLHEVYEVLFDGVVIVPKFIFTSHWTPSIKSILFNPCGYPVHFVWSNRGEPITFSKRTMETFLKRFGLVNKSSILSTGEVC